MRDFLNFKLMVTPLLIQFFFYLGIIAIFISAAYTMIAHGELARGLITLFFGPLLLRIPCELFILLFRIYDTLVDIKDNAPSTIK